MAAAGPDRELEWQEVQAIVDEEIQRMPAIYRDAFVVCCLEQNTAAEASRVLRVKEGTVKSRLFKARALLQQALRRRGVGLSAVMATTALTAATAKAAVSRSLVTSTVNAAMGIAAGKPLATAAVSANVAALLKGATTAMFISQLKTTTMIVFVLVVAGTGVGVGASGRGGAAVTEERLARVEPPRNGPSSQGRVREELTGPPEKEAKAVVEVRGRVLDPDGKLAAGAEVAVVLWEVLTFSSWERPPIDGTRLVARSTSDAEGRFRLAVPQPLPVFRHALLVLARAPGHGIGWATVDSQGTPAEAEVRLLPEGTIAGRVVDLQGGPVVGLKIHASRLTRRKGDGWETLPLPDDAVTATTDDRGRFAFPSIGRGLGAHLEIDDLHCAPKELDINIGDAEKAGHLVIGVVPPAIVEGRVVCEDTGEPVANAHLVVSTYTKPEEGYTTGGGTVDGKTDARALPGQRGPRQHRFRLGRPAGRPAVPRRFHEVRLA